MRRKNLSQEPIKLIFAEKKTNSIGLQIADLVAYPIGRSLVSPENNFAFGIVQRKFYGYPDHLKKGLKIFSEEEDFEKRKTPDFSEV